MARVVPILLAAACMGSGCAAAAAQGIIQDGSSRIVKAASNPARREPRLPKGARICGRPILNSPWNYAGRQGTYTRATEPKRLVRRLPTFGVPKSDFPSATRIIIVPAGDNTYAADHGDYNVDHAVVYFEPGVHYIRDILYAGHNSAYVGGYRKGKKAVLDGVDGATNGTGKGGSRFAVSTPSAGNMVYNTWEYLTIKNYTSSHNNSVLGNVNGGGSDIGDVYKYDTIGPNEYGYAGSGLAPGKGQGGGGGYAIDAGSNTKIMYSCITRNAQGGFNAWGATNLNVKHNEIRWNGLADYPDSGCGCSGGGKVFFSLNASVTYNYIHDNYNTAVWFDFDNAGSDISHNYIAANWGNGITYEASYNAKIFENTLVGNGWASHKPWPPGGKGGPCYGGISCTNGLGPVTGAGGGNPYAAIYVANSGGTREIVSRYGSEVLVKRNTLFDNFGGVAVYTDTNRYPGNINNDSACSVPLGVIGRKGNRTYYRQSRVLVTAADARISGDTVTSQGGSHTICTGYGDDSSQEWASDLQAPSAGMAVFNEATGAFLGTVASVAGPYSFTLGDAPGDAAAVTLLLSAYGGCGPADYYGGGLNRATGRPSGRYWDNCIWGSRNVRVTGNLFELDAAAVRGCEVPVNRCGYMQTVAFNAGVPELMKFFNQYQRYVAMSRGGLGNSWSDNTYEWGGNRRGWRFQAGPQFHDVTRQQWRASPYRQDKCSVFRQMSSRGQERPGRRHPCR